MTLAIAADSTTLLIGNVPVPTRRTSFGVVATIDPTTAKALLGQMVGNRYLRPTKVKLYARDMERGNWHLNGEPMQFDTEGGCLNGQHRLHGVVESGATIETYIIGDLPLSARDSIDSGVPRTAGDMFGWLGEEDSRALAAAIGVAWRLETNGHLFGGGGIPQPSHDDLQAYLADNPAIRDAVQMANRVRKSLVRFQGKLAGGLNYLMANKDADDAADFWERMIDGVGLYPGHPVLALRTVLLKDLQSPRHLPETDRAAITIKAWNAFRERRTVKHLRWRRAGTKPEAFPTIR